MSESEERIKTEEMTEAQESAPAEAPAEALQAQEDDPYVGVQEGYEEPWPEPIEEEVKYVYQKGDFWAFLIAALRVFVPILLLFFGGVMLVCCFFAR